MIVFVIVCLLASLPARSLAFDFPSHKAQTKPAVFYINDGVSNFIYGNKGLEKYFSMITSSTLAIKCPLEKPFTADGHTCFQCTVDAPIFNFSTLKCESCPNGPQSFHNHQCNDSDRP